MATTWSGLGGCEGGGCLEWEGGFWKRVNFVKNVKLWRVEEGQVYANRKRCNRMQIK